MSGSFADLLKKAGLEASPEAATAPATDAEADPEAGPRFAKKVVVRRSKAGRGGKTVTQIQGVLTERAEVARMLQKKLGTGARVEGDDIVVQGDHRDRLVTWLEGEGVKQVVRS